MDMREYLDYVDHVLSKSLERHFYQIRATESPPVKSTKNPPHELQGPAKLRALLRNSRTNSKKLPIIDGKTPRTPSRRSIDRSSSFRKVTGRSTDVHRSFVEFVGRSSQTRHPMAQLHQGETLLSTIIVDASPMDLDGMFAQVRTKTLRSALGKTRR